MTKTVDSPQLSQFERTVLATLIGDDPTNLRVMNTYAISEEIVHGRDVLVQDDEYLDDSEYIPYEEAAVALAERGLLNQGDMMGMQCYCANDEGRKAFRASQK